MISNTYSEIRIQRNMNMPTVAHDHEKLNRLHDDIMIAVIEIAIDKTTSLHGPPPAPFSFFIMGSGGRYEQAIWSDQDHGIIYNDSSPSNQQYFLHLGKEISKGLFKAGYAYCDGGVMASNPAWCKSVSEWKQQLSNWVEDASWEDIRHLLIFIDGRSLYGQHDYVSTLKTMTFESIHQHHLLPRILENTLHIKKGLGVLGQFLTETHGSHTGTLNMKEKVLFPYVNAVRLLAIKDKVTHSSTLSRLQAIPENLLTFHERKLYEQSFRTILGYRLVYGDHTNYDSGHFMAIDKLSSFQKKELKEILKTGTHLYQSVRRLIERDVPHGYE